MPTTTDADRIVLENHRAIGRIGNPNDRNETFDLEKADDDTWRLELPPDRYKAAHAILRRHSCFEVVEPSDSDLVDVKSQREVRSERAKRQARKHRRRQLETRTFDPVEDRPTNARKSRIAKAYRKLTDAVETEAAEDLRSVSPLREQDHHAQALVEDRLGEDLFSRSN